MFCLLVETTTQTIQHSERGAIIEMCTNLSTQVGREQLSMGGAVTGRLNKDSNSVESSQKNRSSPDCCRVTTLSTLSCLLLCQDSFHCNKVQTLKLELYHKEKRDYIISGKRIIQRVVWISDMGLK